MKVNDPSTSARKDLSFSHTYVTTTSFAVSTSPPTFNAKSATPSLISSTSTGALGASTYSSTGATGASVVSTAYIASSKSAVSASGASY